MTKRGEYYEENHLKRMNLSKTRFKLTGNQEKINVETKKQTKIIKLNSFGLSLRPYDSNAPIFVSFI